MTLSWFLRREKHYKRPCFVYRLLSLLPFWGSFLPPEFNLHNKKESPVIWVGIPVFRWTQTRVCLSLCLMSYLATAQSPAGNRERIQLARPCQGLRTPGKVEKWKILKWFPVVEVRTEIQEASETPFTWHSFKTVIEREKKALPKTNPFTRLHVQVLQLHHKWE